MYYSSLIKAVQLCTWHICFHQLSFKKRLRHLISAPYTSYSFAIYSLYAFWTGMCFSGFTTKCSIHPLPWTQNDGNQYPRIIFLFKDEKWHEEGKLLKHIVSPAAGSPHLPGGQSHPFFFQAAGGMCVTMGGEGISYSYTKMETGIFCP